MDCYDLYVHELLMNTNMKIPSIFKEKKNIVNKICCLIRDIRSKISDNKEKKEIKNILSD